MTSDQFIVIVDYVVTNKNTGAFIVFSKYPVLDQDLPPEFTNPGDVVAVSQRVLVRKAKTLQRFIKSALGYKQIKEELSND